MSAPILIWGAGAIGGTIGAYLVRAGHDVVMVPNRQTYFNYMQHAERILFIDDEEVSRNAFSRSMRESAFRVDLAAGSQDAERMVRQ